MSCFTVAFSSVFANVIYMSSAVFKKCSNFYVEKITVKFVMNYLFTMQRGKNSFDHRDAEINFHGGQIDKTYKFSEITFGKTCGQKWLKLTRYRQRSTTAIDNKLFFPVSRWIETLTFYSSLVWNSLTLKEWTTFSKEQYWKIFNFSPKIL